VRSRYLQRDWTWLAEWTWSSPKTPARAGAIPGTGRRPNWEWRDRKQDYGLMSEPRLTGELIRRGVLEGA